MSVRTLFSRGLPGLSAVLLAGWASAGWSQQPGTGTVTGVIRDAQNLGPINAVQMYIPTLQIGTLSQANGRYLLVNVPAGTHEVRVERIGYRMELRQVTVTAGQSTEVNFELTEAALALDEIVVTGTAGQARRREVGNVIAQVRMTQVAEPVQDLGSLLQGRLTGAVISQQGGSSAGGVDIRLRGNVSMTMSNQPLIYIDGVRVRNERYPSEGRSSLGAGADNASPLSDINPEDIDRIEIVKGPAATTLYGTEAAAGVIQIFTKRGAEGAPEFTVESQQGFTYFRPWGTDEVPYMFTDPVLQKGHQQAYQVSVRGGTSDRLGYFVSGRWEDNAGAVQTDFEKQTSVRGNLQVRIREDLQVQFNNSLTRRDYRNTRLGNSVQSIVMTAIRGDRSYMGSRAPETLRHLLGFEGGAEINRFITGFTANYTPSSRFSHRFTLGYDLSQFEGRMIWPFGWLAAVGLPGHLGTIQRTSSQTTLLSVDYVANLGFGVTGDLENTFSWGFQGVEQKDETIWALGNDFPGPGDYTVSSSARREGYQDKLRVITGGFFLQDMLALSDRYFLTLGLRVDGNSAFGQDLGLQPYPKASLSYVISDERFWPERLGEMKLRAAYGFAGRAPGAFDAVRTWTPATFSPDVAAFVPGNRGNPELAPERTRELELGFDASFLRGRLAADFTHYSKTTSDALFRVGKSVTEGGWSAQLENVGEIRNSGTELTLNGKPLDLPSFGWELGVGLTTNQSKVVSLGGAPSFDVGNFGWVIEGQPAPVIQGMKLENAWEIADPMWTEYDKLGPSYPTRIVNVNSTLRLPGGILVSGRGEFQGGFWVYNFQESMPLTRAIPHPKCFDAYRKIDPNWVLGPPGKENLQPTGPRDKLYAWERAHCFGSQTTRMHLAPGDYFELRELTLSVPISSLLPSLTSWARRADLTISGRNVWLWRNKDLMTGHPEAIEGFGQGTGTYSLTKRMGETFPPASHFTVSLRAVF
ncbi:MAG: TonB-dependent receptor [Gemmatimonadetes bacterium]|nr:TonB-dependent receptor [Gemmatimonadota bacterium]